MSDAVSQLAGLACCALGAVLLLAGVAHFFLTRLRRSRAVPAAPRTPDVNVELGLSLVALMRESDAAPPPERAAIIQRSELAARRKDMAGVLAAADAWREAGGTPQNRGAFNDLRRAVDAVAGG